VSLDVVPGRYEGGAKVWECTRDALRHIGGQAGAGSRVAAVLAAGGAVVADVGCGAGLLGVAALAAGAAHCAFLDLNAEVLRRVTMPNVAANVGAAGLRRSSFLAGPWSAIAEAAAASGDAGGVEGGESAGAGEAEAVGERGRPSLRSLLGRVDLVLASETLYAPSSYSAFLDVLEALLTPGTGVALIATKRMYYGVGGGTEAFLRVVALRPGVTASRLEALQDGASIVRDVLLLERAGGVCRASAGT